MKEEELAELETIPGVGKSIAKDLHQIGIRKVSDLKNKNPKKLYEQSNRAKGFTQDPCLLYTFRCAVYFASTHNPQQKLLKWWNWKDKKGKNE